ncbi:MAG: hypothetical protein Alpg2KO_17820 [Alphaproteobacteria bacterium]
MRSKIAKGLMGLVVLVLLALSFVLMTLRERIPTPDKPFTTPIPEYAELPTGWSHTPDAADLPFSGGAALDVDGDGQMELFVSPGRNQMPALLRVASGTVTDLAAQAGLSAVNAATHGATAMDMDGNGQTDLILARTDGIWIYHNSDGRFTARQVAYTPPQGATPLNVAVADINADGLPDLYISHFVEAAAFRPATFNDTDHAKRNTLLLNKGEGRFEDITENSGTAGVQNTFHSSFIDLNDDGLPDLVLANNTGPIEIFKNTGKGAFSPVELDSGDGYWMGLGAGDYDADGDTDLIFTNIGVSIPAALVTGDLDKGSQNLELEWRLFRNDGEFNFTDVTADLGLDGFGFGWGAVFADLDLDGTSDILAAQNYIKWPLHQHMPLGGKALLQRDGKYWQASGMKLGNAHFGQSPVIADFDGDRHADVAWINMAGPARILINQSPAPVLRVNVPDKPLTGTVRVKLLRGEDRELVWSRQIVQATGMGTDMSPNLFIALPDKDSAYTLAVTQTRKQDIFRPLPKLASGQSTSISLPLRPLPQQ